jgi:hypothetical protein
MKFGFICLNVPGHLNPMIAPARSLSPSPSSKSLICWLNAGCET